MLKASLLECWNGQPRWVVVLSAMSFFVLFPAESFLQHSLMDVPLPTFTIM